MTGNAGRYFYNLGAVLVNTGQTEPAVFDQPIRHLHGLGHDFRRLAGTYQREPLRKA